MLSLSGACGDFLVAFADFLERLDRIFVESSIAKVVLAPSSRCNDETVIGLGDETQDLAEWYAQMTNRTFERIALLDGLFDSVPPDVVVTTLEHLDSRVLDYLYPIQPRDRRAVPGIICARTLKGLRGLVERRAAAVRSPPPRKVLRIDVFPNSHMKDSLRKSYRRLGKHSGARAVREAISSGAEVLTIQTHGDGMDVSLGRKLTLCTMDKPFPDADPRHAPRCWYTGGCHRHRGTVQEVWKSGRLLHPESISARILILDTCRGLLPSDSHLDPAWGFLAHMLESSTIEAILTSWEISITNTRSVCLLAEALAGGATAGESLAQIMRSRDSRSRGYRMCLLGDPRLRACNNLHFCPDDKTTH